MKRTAFGIAALLLLSATPCVVNAFTAIAWSQSGQRGGSVKNAPTKETAISAAIADCKKNGGDTDCQVFKVSDEPGFVALYATCAKTCGVTAVTGRATAEQARADGKRECEAHYQASCQLAQEWEEAAPRTSATPSVSNNQTQNSYKTSADLPKNNNLNFNKQKWKFSKVWESHGKLWYLPSSVRRNGSIIKVTTMLHYDKPITFNRIPGTPIHYAVFEDVFDCKNDRRATTSIAYYSSFPDGQPDLINQDNLGYISVYSGDEIVSNVWKDVCGKTPREKPQGLPMLPGYYEKDHDQEFMQERERELRNDCSNSGNCGDYNRFKDWQFQNGIN